jgi:hypothetical protein
MEQQHQLKFHGNYSIFEQAQMTAEERAWEMRRLEREFKEKAEREKQAAANVKRPSVPRPRR